MQLFANFIDIGSQFKLIYISATPFELVYVDVGEALAKISRTLFGWGLSCIVAWDGGTTHERVHLLLCPTYKWNCDCLLHLLILNVACVDVLRVEIKILEIVWKMNNKIWEVWILGLYDNHMSTPMNLRKSSFFQLKWKSIYGFWNRVAIKSPSSNFTFLLQSNVCRQLQLSYKIKPHFHVERAPTFCHLVVFANFASTWKYSVIGIVSYASKNFLLMYEQY